MPDPISWEFVWQYYLLALAFGYLLGSVPFGLIFTRIAGLGDIRTIGSGNIGATNVLRTGKKSLAALTLLCDGLKGTAAVAVASQWGPDITVTAGLGAFLGHLFPIWLKFKGGKGVATYLGILIGLHFYAALVFSAAWLAVAALFRFSSLAALVASAAATISLYYFESRQFAELFTLLTILLWIKHQSNIGRLFRGKEGRIGK